MTWQDLLAQSAWRGTVLLVAAWAASLAMRRASAAWRHFVWTAALAGLLLLPVALAMAPKWGIEAAPLVGAAYHQAATVEATPAPNLPSPRPLDTRPNWSLFWMLGCAASAAWFIAGRLRTWNSLRRSAEAAYAQGPLAELCRARGIGPAVRALENAATRLPLTWGILRPAVVLPADARQWPADRLRTVLLHEMMHVERRDLLAQTIAQAACCLYWFHPLAWIAARQLRQERERACDDAVLREGIAAPDYAGHLMELARSLAADRRRHQGAIAMAERSGLELRVRALLDRRRNRRPLSRAAAAAIAAACIAVLLPAAVITAQAQPALAPPSAPAATAPAPDVPAQQATPPAAQSGRGSLTGVVEDPSAARVPGCEVTARNLDGTNVEVTRADPAGVYRFTAIPPGRYAVEARSAGFATLRVGIVVVTAGQTTTANARLEIGQMSESVVVKGPAATAAAAPSPRAAGRIRVGGNVQACKLIAKIDPVYPPDLKAQGITGTVVIRAIVTKEGYLSSLQVANTDVNAGLATAAMDAVKHWLYQPTLLNGEPVEVLTTITVDFQ